MWKGHGSGLDKGVMPLFWLTGPILGYRSQTGAVLPRMAEKGVLGLISRFCSKGCLVAHVVAAFFLPQSDRNSDILLFAKS